MFAVDAAAAAAVENDVETDGDGDDVFGTNPCCCCCSNDGDFRNFPSNAHGKRDRELPFRNSAELIGDVLFICECHLISFLSYGIITDGLNFKSVGSEFSPIFDKSSIAFDLLFAFRPLTCNYEKDN